MDNVFTPSVALKEQYKKLSTALAEVRPDIQRGQTAALKAPNGDEIPLPEDFFKILIEVVQAMQAGQSISVTHLETKMTTQQAAEYLGISRPTFIKLIGKMNLPVELVGKHRRVSIKDVIVLQSQLRSDRGKALEQIAQRDSELGTYSASDEVLFG